MRLSQTLLIFLLILLGGCAKFQYSENVTIDQEAFASNPPRSLAMVPFSNASGVENADELARRGLYSSLAGHRYQDVELSRIDSVVSDLANQYNLEPDEIPPPLIRRAGLADAVLTGHVQQVSKRWALIYSAINVVCNLELVDTRTNRTIYKNTARGRNQRFTAPLSILTLFTGALDTFQILRSEEVDETFEELAQRVAKTFPDPAHSGDQTLSIREPSLSLPRNPLAPGDEISIQFEGTAGREAQADIGSIQQNVRMPEIEPGLYRLRYRIPTGTRVDYATVRLRLRQAPDRQAELQLYNMPFSVRELPSNATARR